jgi:pyrrolidone-carboxylate peptidase
MMIVLCAFEPFGGRKRNRSLDVARLAAKSLGVRVDVLPVRFDRLGRAVAKLLSTHPDVLLMLGEHHRATRLHVERTAHNRIVPRIPDNAGRSPRGPVRRGGPETLRSTLPPRSAVAALSRHAPTRLSDDAGGFACNAALYHALDLAARRRLRTRVGFVHVPLRGVGLRAAATAIAALCARFDRARARC